jgi:hypothetical protein
MVVLGLLLLAGCSSKGPLGSAGAADPPSVLLHAHGECDIVISAQVGLAQHSTTPARGCPFSAFTNGSIAWVEQGRIEVAWSALQPTVVGEVHVYVDVDAGDFFGVPSTSRQAGNSSRTSPVRLTLSAADTASLVAETTHLLIEVDGVAVQQAFHVTIDLDGSRPA